MMVKTTATVVFTIISYTHTIKNSRFYKNK